MKSSAGEQLELMGFITPAFGTVEEHVTEHEEDQGVVGLTTLTTLYNDRLTLDSARLLALYN